MYQDLWQLRSDVDFYNIKTNQRLISYQRITANLERLEEQVKDAQKEKISQVHDPAIAPQ